MAKASDDSVATYLRIPRSAHATLSAAAKQLNMPISKVTNAIFHFTLSEDAFQDHWFERVRVVRDCANDAGRVQIHDFTAVEWDRDKRRIYDWLDRMGLVEDFNWRLSSNASGRIICSFKVSDTGRVIAEVFQNAGWTDAPDEADVDGAHEGHSLAV